MSGWSIRARAWRSASKRARTSRVSMPSLMTLSATRRRDRLALLGEVDDAHAALAEDVEDVIGADVVGRAEPAAPLRPARRAHIVGRRVAAAAPGCPDRGGPSVGDSRPAFSRQAGQRPSGESALTSAPHRGHRSPVAIVSSLRTGRDGRAARGYTFVGVNRHRRPRSAITSRAAGASAPEPFEARRAERRKPMSACAGFPGERVAVGQARLAPAGRRPVSGHDGRKPRPRLGRHAAIGLGTRAAGRLSSSEPGLHRIRPALKLGTYKQQIRQRPADILGVAVDQVGLQAKTGEEVGPIGRQEAVAAQCVVPLAATVT